MLIGELTICAVLAEGVTEYLGGLIPKRFRALFPKQALAALVGVILCVAARVDLFVLLGVPLGLPFLGAVCTGILVSRGSNYLHDIWGRLKK